MRNNTREVKNLKRCLKKKITIGEALVVMFLITGGVSYSVTTLPAIETSKIVEQNAISNRIVEKFANPQDESKYFQYEISLKEGVNKEKILEELKIHIIKKQPRYFKISELKDEGIIIIRERAIKELEKENITVKDTDLIDNYKIKQYIKFGTMRNRDGDLDLKVETKINSIVRREIEKYEKEVCILSQPMNGYGKMSVGTYLSNNQGELLDFKYESYHTEFVIGGVGTISALTLLAIKHSNNHDSDVEFNNNGNNPGTDPDNPSNPDSPDNPDNPDNPGNPEIPEIPNEPDSVIYTNGEAQDGTFLRVKNFSVTTSVGIAAIETKTTVISAGTTTFDSETESIGMATIDGAIGINSGIMNLNNEEQVGMLAKSTNGEQTIVANRGTIQGTSNVAIISEGENAIGINDGTIANASAFGPAGMYAVNEAIAKNGSSGIINVETSYSYGMYAGSDATIINEGIIDLNKGNNATGMFAEMGGTLVNNGIIYSEYSDNVIGIHATGLNTTAKNYGVIDALRSDGDSYGMKVQDGALAVNETTGIIFNDFKYGMYAESSGMALNKGIVRNMSYEEKSYGMYAENGGVALNEGTISNYSQTNETYGMYAGNGGTILNEGVIDNWSEIIAYGMYAAGTGVTATNYGIISTNGQGSYGMYAYSGAIVINYGDIINISSSTNGAYGYSFGMYAGDGATILNEASGIISNISETDNSAGMYANSGAIAINRGEISNEALDYSYGIYAGTETTALNYGVISNTSTGGERAYGIYATSGATATNESTGVINVDTANSYGMYGVGSGTTIINVGTINLNADGGTGMYATNGAALVNEGTINLNSTNGTGIHATGTGTTVTNSGEIYISGNIVNEGEAGWNTPGAGENQAMKIEDGAKFVNNGLFSVEGELNTTAITGNGGQFIVESGTVEAETIRGDFYASGALAMGGYANTYDTYQMFKADNMYANIYSNSAMFNAELTAQDNLGYYGVEMTRKNFNEIIDNSGYAQYLENNYTEANNTEEKEDLYDAYKLIVTESDLNKAVDSTFGNTIYPTLMYQTLSAIRDVNNDIKDNVFGRNQFAELNGIRYIGFGKYRDSEVNFNDSRLTEYDREMSTVTLGADKAINENIRLGALLTVGKADYDFDNGDSREDDMYQLNFIGSYEKDDVLATATAYIGKTDGNLDRTLSFTSINEEMEGDVENSYYGVDLSLEKRYKLTSFNITPRVELNTIHVEQDNVNEKGTYALDVEKTEATSVEGGVGVKVDKVIDVGNGYKVTPKVSAMYYREFADPYEDSTATMSSVSSDKVKIESYDAGKDRGEIYGAVEIKKNDLGVTMGVNYKVDSEGDEVTPFVGISYTF